VMALSDLGRLLPGEVDERKIWSMRLGTPTTRLVVQSLLEADQPTLWVGGSLTVPGCGGTVRDGHRRLAPTRRLHNQRT
jgi:hypothetical protein